MLNPEQIQEMIELRQTERLTLSEIGRRFGVTAERVRQLLNARGISTARKTTIKPPRVKTPSVYDWDEITRLYLEQEMSSYDIAEAIDGNATYIRQGLKNLGVIRNQRDAVHLKMMQRQLA